MRSAPAWCRDGNGKSVGIPIIVKAWHVAPLDMFFQAGKTLPLNEENLARAFYQSSIGVGVAPQKAPPNLADDATADTRVPPLGGKYSYSAPLSMVALVDGTLGAEDLEHFRKVAADSPELFGQFHKRKNFGLLCKWAAAKAAPTDQAGDNRQGPCARHDDRQEGRPRRIPHLVDKRPDVRARPDHDRPAGHQGHPGDPQAEFSDAEADPMGLVDKNGEYTITAPKGPYGEPVEGASGNGVDGSGGYGAELGPRRNPLVVDPRQDSRDILKAEKYGRYGVRDKDGVLARGWLLPHVVDFDGGVVSGMKLFVGRAISAMQNRIAGVPLNDEVKITLTPESPDTGKTGTMVYREGDRAIATVPFQSAR
jgi:hypothetical protein